MNCPDARALGLPKSYSLAVCFLHRKIVTSLAPPLDTKYSSMSKVD